MKKSKLLALLLALTMVLALFAGCGKQEAQPAQEPAASNNTTAETAETPAGAEEAPAAEEDYDYGPIYDEWSEMTDEELYQLALEVRGRPRV